MRACVEEARAYDEEGADSQSLDLRAQWVEEGLTEECEEEERLEEEEEVEVEVEVEAIDPGDHPLLHPARDQLPHHQVLQERSRERGRSEVPRQHGPRQP